MKEEINLEEFKMAVKESNTIADVLRKLGKKPWGANYRTVHRYVKLLQLDTSHWTGFSHMSGKKRINLQIDIQSILVKDRLIKSNYLKRKLVECNLLSNKCYECNLTDWRGKKIVLHLDHINGDHFDNQLSNLRLMCPNCHSQTDTYCGRNRNKTPHNFCGCGKQILRSSFNCVKCAAQITNARMIKIKWPSINKLKKMVAKYGFLQSGKKLGVSDNAIRKRLKNHASDDLNKVGTLRHETDTSISTRQS